MEIRKFINTDSAYKKAEDEIREWVESHYPGLSIEFKHPAPEIVQVYKSVRYRSRRVRRIVEAVNIKIGDILESYAEEIYIADILDRIYKRHPNFTIDVESINDIKSDKQFLKYMRELRAARG